MKDIKNYSNGVYYFPYNWDEFGRQLSLFLEEHGDLEVAGLSVTGGYGDGYFVVFKKIKQ